MKSTRRSFLKGMAALSAMAMSPTLVIAQTKKETEVGGFPMMTDDVLTWKVTGSHWGLFVPV
nr:twin-arginine translocation signal domain-containing protein [Paenalcaligenes hominis]